MAIDVRRATPSSLQPHTNDACDRSNLVAEGRAMQSRWRFRRDVGAVLMTVAVMLAFFREPCAAAQITGSIHPRLSRARPAEPDTRSQSDSKEVRLKAEVSVVLVPVTVTDRNGRTIDIFSSADFAVYEDGQPQHLLAVSHEDVPASIGIVLDVSKSMKDKVDTARVAIRSFLQQAEDEDELFLLTFANRPQLRVGLTRNPAEIMDNLIGVKPAGNTALIDGVYMGLQYLHNARTSRKALVVISDGGDNYSRFSKRELMSVLREADVQIYTVGIMDVSQPKRGPMAMSDDMRSRALLEDIAEESGGTAHVIGSLNKLEDAVMKVARAVHNQYLLTYRPAAGATQPDKWRRIRIELVAPEHRAAFRVQHRRGYYGRVE